MKHLSSHPCFPAIPLPKLLLLISNNCPEIFCANINKEIEFLEGKIIAEDEIDQSSAEVLSLELKDRN